MASKYLTGGSPTYTASVRTLAGCTMSTGFASGDERRAVVFRIGSGVFIGRVSAVVSATSVRLETGAATLPLGDGVVDALFLVDTLNAHLYGDYIARIGVLIQDTTHRLEDWQVQEMLAAAVTDYGEDAPQFFNVRVAGTGAGSYNLSAALGSNWQYGKTTIERVEYPSGENPPSYLERTDWLIHDDGTAQDGSNVVIMFTNYQPASGEYFVLQVRRMLALDSVAGANFPDTDSHFNNITLLASAYCCFAIGSSYATSSDSTMSADSVNYNEKMDKYLRLGREFLKRYNISVFGSEEPTNSVGIATITKPIVQRASDRAAFLFHR